MKKKIIVKCFNKNLIINAILLLCVAFVGFFSFYDEVTSVFNISEPKAYYFGNLNNNNVSLMINVYWGTEYLPDMLDVLKDENVKVTFFVGGMWAIKNSEILQRMYNEGHEIANHGYYHKDQKYLSYEDCENEIYNTHKIVKELLDIDMNLFAPPSGSYSKTSLKVADNLGYTTIMWTKDTIDWRDKDESLCYERAIKNAKNGDLILMHPTAHTLSALKNIIKYYKDNNFNLTTVSNTIKEI